MTDIDQEKDLPVRYGNVDRRAFESIFAAHHQRVFSVALNFFGGDRQAAEDVTQQVFLKIFTSAAIFRGEAGLTTWLYRITVNACIDERRKSRRFSFLTDLFGLKEPKVKRNQEESFDRRELSGEVRQAVGTLKPIFRWPILLKYVEGLSYREIADILGCSEGTVASRLNRGHKLLAEKLGHLRGEV